MISTTAARQNAEFKDTLKGCFATSTRDGKSEFSDSIKKGSNSNAAQWPMYHFFSLVCCRCLSLSALKTCSGRKLAGLSELPPVLSAVSFFSSVMAQPCGSVLAVSCCASCRAISTSARSCSPAWLPISSMRPNASKAPLKLDKSFPSALSFSWRRAISACIAVTINPADDSPSRFSDSMPDTTSWGTLTVNSCDLAFLFAEAIGITPLIFCVSVYVKLKYKKVLTCVSRKIKVKHILSTGRTQQEHRNSEALQMLATSAGLLTTTVNNDNEEAMKEHNTHPQGRPSYTWRFLALSAIGRNVIHINATTEREAREQSPAGCVMVFAGRIRQEVRHA